MTKATILIVEDEEDLAAAYSSWLASDYTVRTANTGAEALDKLDETVDIVLLDRRLPDIAGRDVLDEIRSNGHNCRVAMVTAVTPDVDILEMGFDDYLLKPVSRTDLHKTIDTLLELATYHDLIQQCYQLASKKIALETTQPEAELRASSAYSELLREFESVQARAEAMVDDISAENIYHAIS